MVTPPRLERPNFVFILGAGLHARALGAAGNRLIHTPIMDRLAAEGTLFTQCHVSCPSSAASRASVLTGQYAFRHGATRVEHAIRPGAPRMAALLARYGYFTGYVGAWCHAGQPQEYGFEHVRHVAIERPDVGGQAALLECSDDASHGFEQSPTAFFTQGALELLERRLQEPFALFLWYSAPQDGHAPPAPYDAMFPADGVPLPSNFAPQAAFPARDGAEEEGGKPLDPAAVRGEIGRYYGQVSHLDAEVGRLIAALEEREAFGNTVLIAAGDSGLSLGAHGIMGNGALYEEAVHVPLILRGPGIPENAQCSALTDLMDIMPTMCDLAGVPMPSGIEGRTLTPLLAGKRSSHRSAIFSHWGDGLRMVKAPPYKLIAHVDTGVDEFFDLDADPFEATNLADSAAHQPALQNLREELAAARRRAGEPAAEQSS
ncbi:MAG: sulfatase-like hydrolase/transferase [Candidatus Hydrogenedentes bacterium]|nr:sulfatase-like hydrolase/transferase [Candidatus Hydrogenedentota bacterium]